MPNSCNVTFNQTSLSLKHLVLFSIRVQNYLSLYFCKKKYKTKLNKTNKETKNKIKNITEIKTNKQTTGTKKMLTYGFIY